MGVRKAEPLRGQPVEIRRLKLRVRIQATGISEALIIGVNHDDVRLLGRVTPLAAQRDERHGKKLKSRYSEHAGLGIHGGLRFMNGLTISQRARIPENITPLVMFEERGAGILDAWSRAVLSTTKTMDHHDDLRRLRTSQIKRTDVVQKKPT